MTTGTPPPDGNTPLHWGQATNDTGNVRTTKTATFASSGKEYTVTVSYNRAAVREKYGVGDEAVDQKIQEVISRIGEAQLSKLSGHSISTSLSDPDTQTRFKALTETDFHEIPASLATDNADLFKTINTIKSIFKGTFELPKGGSDLGQEDDEIDLTVEEHGEGRRIDVTDETVRLDVDGQIGGADEGSRVVFREVTDAPQQAQQTGTSFRLAFRGIIVIDTDLSKLHPLKGKREQIQRFVDANLAIPGNAEEYDDQVFKQHKDVLLEILRDDSLGNWTPDLKNDIIKELKCTKLADEIRVELKLQDEEDVILDISQSQIRVEGKPEGVGQFACASICGEAIYFLQCSNPDEDIDTREQLIRILKKGIERHLQEFSGEGVPPSKYFQDSMENCVVTGLQETFDRVSSSKYFVSVDNITSETKEKLFDFEEDYYVILTVGSGSADDVNTKSILLYKDKDENFCIFDSHATTIKEASRGASVLRFTKSEVMKRYLVDRYPENLWSLDKVEIKRSLSQ